MTNKLPVAILFLFFCSFGAAAQERYLRPVDEARDDPTFLAFRTKLIVAVEKRDARYILSIVDPKIELSFGGDAGLADFKRIWKIGQKNSPFWDEFLTVIRNGGSFDRKSGRRTIFFAPYSFNSFPEDLDAFEHQVIFGNNVNLRERPEMNAPVLTSLSYNVVKIDQEGSVRKRNPDGGFEWLKVTTLGGKSGFVKSEFVRSPIDYRAGFEKKRGVWKMTVFIAGD